MIHFPNAATNNVQRVNEPHLDPDTDQNARSYVSRIEIGCLDPNLVHLSLFYFSVGQATRVERIGGFGPLKKIRTHYRGSRDGMQTHIFTCSETRFHVIYNTGRHLSVYPTMFISLKNSNKCSGLPPASVPPIPKHV